MRSLAAVLVMSAALVGCRCGPDAPTPVTLRLKNTSLGPVYVDDSDGRLGTQVQRRVSGDWLSFVEQPRCACQACDVVCSGCDCEGDRLPPRVRKVSAGESLERVWSGAVQVSGTGSCAGALLAGPSCLRLENPPLDETFRLELCYSPEAPGVEEGDGGSVPGVLPEKSIQCVSREFKPIDAVVEVSPRRGADCREHTDCSGVGELCFAGGCTSSCPASGFPEVGGSWQVRVEEPDDQGFFELQRSDAGSVYVGTGSIGSVLYQNGTMTLRLTRPGPGGGVLTGAVYLSLPPGNSVPLTAGLPVGVKLVDASAPSGFERRALTVRELDGGLVLAADTGQGGVLLRAEDTAPFAVEVDPKILACQHDDCGKRLHFATRFGGGAAPVVLDPGKTSTEAVGGATYRLLSVAAYAYRTSHCRLKVLTPFAILRQGAEGQGP